MESDHTWNAPPPDLVLSADEVHVWSVALDQPTERVQTLWRLLSAGEQTRAERFHFDRDRRRYIVSQGTLRTLLGQYLHQPADRIEFAYGVRGKPSLKGNAEFRFNASHSHERALYAITRKRESGVDIEYIRAMPDADQIVARFFAPQEQAAYRALPLAYRQEAFFQCWTRKEAFIKARGEGLYRALDQFAVSLAPGEPARLLWFEPDETEIARWSFQALTPAPGYAATAVVEGQGWRLACWEKGYE